MVLQFLDQFFSGTCFIVFGQYDSSFYYLSANLIGYSGDGTFYDGRVRHQSAFHFERADTVTGTLDYVVCTSYKPKVSVFVFPRYITCVVNAVVPSLVCTFRIPIVLFEKSERFAFAGTDHNLSLLSGFHGATFTVDQVYVILRIGQSHASRFRFHPRHGGNCQCRFRLSETFHQLDACQFLEGFEYGRVQCFSGNGAIPQ